MAAFLGAATQAREGGLLSALFLAQEATMPGGGFVKEHTFEKRVAEAERIRKKFPDRVPVSANAASTQTERAHRTLSSLRQAPFRGRTGAPMRSHCQPRAARVH